MQVRLVLLLAAFAATPAVADVVAVTPGSFEISQTVTINAPVANTWDMLRAPQKWWNKDHTYSGDSANLYLDSQATGCFCERLPGGGSVEHGRIVHLRPQKMMRLNAALGPLQAEAVTGTLTWTLTAEGENATRIKLTYVVGGHIRGGAEALAPAVDEVMAVQMLGLKSATEAMPAPEAQPAKE
ncbi:SRPBCC family protein [Sphingomonas sp. 28-62-11]|uniref:SRPBCC family protein n=1 Tax=Sphingomonas sp. 28-62-11 TaxID=1970432 RepID=UPI000BCC8B71|nr:MAG: hypothetical protein B7Y49_10120 [Sphingomonas sp. 28-62-11]